MKTFDRKDVYSWANCKDAKEYIGKKGFLGSTLGEISERLNKGEAITLQDVDDTNINCFYFEIGVFKDCSSGLFLPLDKVKEVEEPKKYRPFRCMADVIFTTQKQVGQSICYRKKNEPNIEIISTINGFGVNANNELQFIELGVLRIEPNALLEYYEWKGERKPWQPFGVEE